MALAHREDMAPPPSWSTALLLIALPSAGCASAPPDAPDYEVVSGGSTRGTGGAGDDEDEEQARAHGTEVAAPSTPRAGTPAAPGGPDVVWSGKLARTAPVDYGGAAPYCRWSMTFRDVEVALTVDGAGGVKAANVRARMIETTPSCPTKPIPENVHRYAEAEAGARRPVEQPLTIELPPDPANKPQASLVLSTTRSGDAIRARLRWHRTDRPAPFDWTVVAEVTLTRP